MNRGAAEPDADFVALKALFAEVCDMPDEAAVRAHLAARGARSELVAGVLALVREDAAHTANSTRFSRPVAGMLASVAGPELAVGDVLGAWRLVRELGEGGMGRVFLAERNDGHYEQRAAVKLLRGFNGPGALEQLARERQILASLDHPHIARLVDGGATPAGRPYLVMDFVQGQPLDAYCAEQRPGLDATLELFGMVCDAVAYAHRQLVVHCDIKPGNVLVGADRRVRLLDFGIAQLQGRDEEAPRALTPRYASPEQRAGAPGSVAGDIYSLGRVLAEMVDAMPPRALHGARLREMQAIVDRACAEAPASRYPGVEPLQADLRRFRHHLPVWAVDGGWPYRWRKALRRQWPWALAGAGAVALSAGFTLRVMAERDRALQAEAAAEREAAATRQVSTLLVSLFEGADPARAGRPDVSAASLVDRGRERVAVELREQPELQATMLGVLGEVYQHMGQPRHSIDMYRQAVDAAQRLGQPAREAVALRRLASVLGESSEPANGIAPARRSLEIRRTLQPPPLATEVAESMDTLGYLLASTGSFDEAGQLLVESLAMRRRHQGEAHGDIANTLHLLGYLAARRGQLPEAEARFREAYAMRLKLFGAASHQTLISQQQLGATLSRQRRLPEAEALLRDHLVRRRALHGPDSGVVATALNELANVEQDAGHTQQAIAHYREAIAIEEKVAGRTSMRLAVAVNNLASALEEHGDPAAEAAYRDSLELRQARLPAGDLGIARAQHNLARWLVRHGRLAEARPLVEASLAVRESRLPAGHDEVVVGRLLRAELALAQGQGDVARGLLDGLAAVEAAMLPVRRGALARAQALALEASGRGEEALALRRQAQALLDESLPQGHVLALAARLELAARLMAMGQTEAARAQWRVAAPALAAQHAGSPLRGLATGLQARLDGSGAVRTSIRTNPRQ